jgi:hypothetical protein
LIRWYLGIAGSASNFKVVQRLNAFFIFVLLIELRGSVRGFQELAIDFIHGGVSISVEVDVGVICEGC